MFLGCVGVFGCGLGRLGFGVGFYGCCSVFVCLFGEWGRVNFCWNVLGVFLVVLVCFKGFYFVFFFEWYV